MSVRRNAINFLPVHLRFWLNLIEWPLCSDKIQCVRLSWPTVKIQCSIFSRRQETPLSDKNCSESQQFGPLYADYSIKYDYDLPNQTGSTLVHICATNIRISLSCMSIRGFACRPHTNTYFDCYLGCEMRSQA